MAKLTNEEKKWRAESDAYTLMRANEIANDKDPDRKKMADEKLSELKEEKEKELNSLNDLTSRKKDGKYPWTI
ncbi:hypothetical protein MHBO_003996 [Bonamia ostreae]|uniref:Uncharacterized protein n=1 Tax=Bonamia ostreae TaxID=126728 RepID=A0ABV2ASV8_9EUKA